METVDLFVKQRILKYIDKIKERRDFIDTIAESQIILLTTLISKNWSTQDKMELLAHLIKFESMVSECIEISEALNQIVYGNMNERGIWVKFE